MALYSRYLLLALLVLVAGCSSVKVTDYSDMEPAIDLETFFQGELTAHGVVKNRAGRVIRTFNADITAYWENSVGVLEEHFLFDDGEKDFRKWVLTPTGDGTYVGTAGDVVGDGQLTFAGNSVFLDYVLRIPYGDGSVDVRVDDRMYLVAPGVLINESEMTKFGVKVGSLLLVILQTPQESTN
ncbi:MAG: DUF3833 domain-containing protein [Halioglobus sp.]